MTRLARAWSALEREQHLAALAALALVLTMLLPWYSKTVTVVVGNAARATQTSLSGIGAMSFVEAAVLLVSVGVLALLFARAENRAFHMPGSDGAIVTIAGGWAALLIFYRLLDKPSLSGTQRITATVGVKWGIFFALASACLLVYAGQRMRAASAPEAPLVRAPRRRRVPADQDVTVVSPTRSRAGRPPHAEVQPPDHGQPSSPVVEPGSQPPPRTTPSPPSSADPAPASSRAQTPRAPGSTPSKPRGSARTRPRFPPAPSDQLSFEDPPPERDGD